MRTRAALILTATYAVIAAAMFGWAIPRVTAVCGMPPLDGRFSWDATVAESFAAACGPSGLSAYQVMQVLDLLYPALFGATLVAWALALAPRRWRAGIVVGFAAIAVAFDYLENVAAWTILAQSPRWAEAAPLRWAAVVSVVKNVAGSLAMVGVLALVVVAVVGRVQRRTGPKDVSVRR